MHHSECMPGAESKAIAVNLEESHTVSQDRTGLGLGLGEGDGEGDGDGRVPALQLIMNP
jgi:hypothetical protein